MTGERALSLPEAASALHPVGNRKPMPISERQPSDARGLCQRPLQSRAPFPLQWTLDDGQPFLPIPAEKPLNGCKACTVKGYPKCSFLLSPEPVSLCSKSSHARQEFVGKKRSRKTQESVKLCSQRRGRAKICHKQTDQPGAHINGLLCCVPTAGWERYFAYHYCSYTKHSSAAAEHCKPLQRGDFLSPFF